MQNKELENVSTIAIGGHIRPDGDCVGSCVGLGQYIRENYSDKTVDIYLKDIPESFHFLNGTETILESVDNEEKIYDVLKLLDIDIKNTTTKIADDFYYDIGFTKEMLNDLRFKEE